MRINVAYAVPPHSRKAQMWHDGFTEAIRIIALEHEVTWLNLHSDAPDHDTNRSNVLDCDFLLVKANWDGVVNKLLQPELKNETSARKGLMISGSAKPPRSRLMHRYDVLFYETPWYAELIDSHPLTIHAFGIDTEIMTPPAPDNERRDIDWLGVGRIMKQKRHDALIAKTGRRVIASDYTNADNSLRSRLEANGIEILDYQSQEDLAALYRRAQNVSVNCELQGGGERAVLEARACGASVSVANDNEKLRGLLGCEIWNQHYYAQQLLDGMKMAADTPRRSTKWFFGR